ncbi:MAG: substrate-binding domain-containing protein, partial [Bacteroidales bacterium]|nr:substrate-binding domain-containing protein [Bacteroidales bacterium]
RSLKGNHSYIIGVIVPKIAHTYFSSAISGIQDTAKEKNYHVFLCDSDETYEKEVRAIHELTASNVDGIIMSLSAETKRFDHLKPLHEDNFPVVYFDRVCTEFDCSRVIISHKYAAYEAVTHLLRKGCKNIIHLSGPTLLSITQNRIQGYKEALESHFIPYSINNVIEVGYNPKELPAILDSKLASFNNIDGISCFNDEIAIAAIKYFQGKGVKIPEELKIIGFNNEEISTIVSPTLTTIEHPAYTLGQEAAKLLLNQIENKSDYRNNTIVVPHKLVERESTQ